VRFIRKRKRFVEETPSRRCYFGSERRVKFPLTQAPLAQASRTKTTLSSNVAHDYVTLHRRFGEIAEGSAAQDFLGELDPPLIAELVRAARVSMNDKPASLFNVHWYIC